MKWVLIATIVGIFVVVAIRVRIYSDAPQTVEGQMSQNDCWLAYVDKKLDYGQYKLCVRTHTVK